jgi:hypothetical protein
MLEGLILEVEDGDLPLKSGHFSEAVIAAPYAQFDRASQEELVRADVRPPISWRRPSVCGESAGEGRSASRPRSRLMAAARWCLGGSRAG